MGELGRHTSAGQWLDLQNRGWWLDLQYSTLGLQMMQEWLGQHKLDRKALAALASNAQAVQVYEQYLRNQVQDVMEDLLADFDEPSPAQGTPATYVQDKTFVQMRVAHSCA